MSLLTRVVRRVGTALAAAAALCGATTVQAETPLTLYKSFSGNVNFAGTQVTIRDRQRNASPCTVSAESVRQSAMLTMPATATVVSAQLYWAGSGATDISVNMNSLPVTGTSARTYTSSTIGGGFDYFSVAADVTAQVRAKGAGTYTFSGLRVSTGSPWCERSAVMGGYALVVVYSHADEIYRTLNLYEGFRHLLNSEQRVDMSNFRVPPNITPSAVGRFGHLAWEGDLAIAQQGESLYFHNALMTHPTYAPAGNNFNSKSSVNGDELSLGIDFDSYSLTGWPAGLSTVSASFRTGGDMMLLNVAVLAVPNSPAADVAVELARISELRAGSTASYTATVTNLGPGLEPGPTKVSFPLPAGLSYSSFSGVNWSCAAAGATVTCTYTGALAMNASTVLTLRVLVAGDATGSKIMSATVAGNNDPVSMNNNDTDTASVVASGSISYEYTARACTAGERVGDGGSCPLFSGPVYAGAVPTIYLTSVDSNNRAKAVSTTQSTTVTLDLALGCVNPMSSGGVRAIYAGRSLPECVADGAVASTPSAWVRVSGTVSANQISLGIPFQYLDVGAVKLYVRTLGGVIDFAQFVSMPQKLGLTITNAQGQANPQTTTPTLGLAQDGFARAGEKFAVEVKGLSVLFTDNGSYRYILPNFGKEQGKLARPLIKHTVTRLDLPASGATGVTLAPLEGSFPDSGAFISTNFAWSDIGSMQLRMALEDYLGEYPNADASQNVGRFYPAHFSTYTGGEERTQLAGFACLARMNCPIVGLAAVKGAVYSGQPFDATVLAHDENGRKLGNFDSTRFPSLVPTLALTAVDAPGSGLAFGARFTPGLADTASKLTTRSVNFRLGALFNAAAARTPMAGPTAVYLRATAPEKRMGTALTLSTVQKDVEESEEGGVMVVNGRLSVASTIGAGLLRTPVAMQAQYWNGIYWENNPQFSHASLFNSTQAQYTNCTRTLAATGGVLPTNCNTTLVRPAATGALAMTGGVARFDLAPVGAGQSGHVRIQFNGPAWLPSMFGQVTIGVYRAPVIYVREMY